MDDFTTDAASLFDMLMIALFVVILVIYAVAATRDRLSAVGANQQSGSGFAFWMIKCIFMYFHKALDGATAVSTHETFLMVDFPCIGNAHPRNDLSTFGTDS